jgi:hypothetical protein
MRDEVDAMPKGGYETIATFSYQFALSIAAPRFL